MNKEMLGHLPARQMTKPRKRKDSQFYAVKVAGYTGAKMTLPDGRVYLFPKTIVCWRKK